LEVQAEDLYILAETNLFNILHYIEELSPDFVVIDSIQTVFKEEVTSAPGSVTQVRECTMELMKVAKSNDIPIFIVGHVTKEGAIAGPRMLEHMVDVVLYFEGEQHHTYRIVRSVKNRFGITHEMGIFTQVREGMMELMKVAKSNDIPIFSVGHVTKEGAIAGPRMLEHMVDVVLCFGGEQHQTYRIVRSVKDRFGSTYEMGIFDMKE